MFNSDKRTTDTGMQYFTPLRVISVLAFVLCLALWLATLFFLYSNIYKRQEDIQMIMQKTGDAMHVIDTQRLETIEEVWNNKTATGTLRLPRNVFVSKTTPQVPLVPKVEGR